MNRTILVTTVAACLCIGRSAPLLATEAVITAQAASPASGLALANAASNDKLRAAAEPFEKLTEISFQGALPAINQTISDAEAAARDVRPLLSINMAGKLDTQIAAMKSAHQNQDQAGLALSSIEAYRVLVSTVSNDAKVPNEVGLLDYAGFRYDADLKASPVRWSDMAEAVSFARENWAKILPRAKSSPVAIAFEKSIADMEKAGTQKNKTLAASSVKTELDFVDQLEKYFSAH